MQILHVVITRHIIFDFGNSKLYVKKGNQFNKPFDFNLSGLVVKAEGIYLRDYEINIVRENSAAEEAGLKKGDRILEIDGTITNELGLDEVIGRLNDKENKKIKLRILRDGKSLYIQFKLRRLI